jgi:hypothetical protein
MVSKLLDLKFMIESSEESEEEKKSEEVKTEKEKTEKETK